ncbi:MAG: HAD hydrolase-like protein [Bacteroidales bacterium]|nr:HAD hydrolase-like protein [Bacteroidales bacterium]
MDKNHFEAVIFDLDGVITKTALVHSSAWKTMFDEYLKSREQRLGEPFVEFTHENDYLPYVDGKPRYKGVEDFLISRGIKINFGDPSDIPTKETICGLGNRKNQAFNETLDKQGVQTYPSTVEWIEWLLANDIKIGVASSSKNCKVVLEAAGLLDVMQTRVDGEVSVELGLKGKPEADIFTTACNNLQASPYRTIIVEDAVSGVQAGAKGNFGLVIGLAREDNAAELKKNGADIVVEDMSEITPERINNWFEKGLKEEEWQIKFNDYVPEKEKSREALLTVGNGYFGTRGAMEEVDAGEFNYPGTYMAGLYNRLSSQVGDRDIENEDYVNTPNWIKTTFKIDQGDWICPENIEIVSIERKLDLKTATLFKEMIIKDSQGRLTEIKTKRIASMHDKHHAAMSYSISPINYSGNITFRTGINGDLINDGVARYRLLNQNHLKALEQGAENDVSWLCVETTQSGVKIAHATKNELSIDGEKKNFVTNHIVSPASVFQELSAPLTQKQVFSCEKIVCIYTSRKDDVSEPLQNAKQEIHSMPRMTEMLEQNTAFWKRIWEKADIQIKGDRLSQKLIRLHLYHTFVSASPNNKDIDAGITARGLHGEAYRGHVFWDEIFILPLYTMHFPEITKSLLMYRYNRMDQARAYAKQYGFRGAMFPWQSGSDGREETQILHLNPLSGEWGDDYSCLQRHVSLAIAFNIWQYYNMTDDLDFMKNQGAEMFLEICRFWASKAEQNTETGRYSIGNVMGPDEFHEKYPDSKQGGLRDNAYTNIMVAWSFEKAQQILGFLDEDSKAKLQSDIKLTNEELNEWLVISRNLNLIISEKNILAQYDGYFELKELDWEYYKEKYGNIYRMDRILKSEGKSADDFKVAKQADTLMTYYNLDNSEITRLITQMGYPWSEVYLKDNYNYYLKRTSHGSTLSRVVHGRLAGIMGEKELSWSLYEQALGSDYADIQGGTTAEGIHTGVMAGTVLIALTTYAGLNYNGDILQIEPNLPQHWDQMLFGFNFKGVHYNFEIKKDVVRIKANQEAGLFVNGQKIDLHKQEWVNVNARLTN